MDNSKEFYKFVFKNTIRKLEINRFICISDLHKVSHEKNLSSY